MRLEGKHIILAVTNDLTFDRRMSRICSALADAGARVTLVGRLLKNSIPFSSPKFRGVRLKCIFNKGPLFYLEYNMRLCWYLLNAEFDVVCAC
ncbi:MAG: glycosyltransferase, partial [Saprospiraceae bacterium]